MKTVSVSVDAGLLRTVLMALVGPSHHIRELTMTQSLPDNPITKLVEAYNSAVTVEGWIEKGVRLRQQLGDPTKDSHEVARELQEHLRVPFKDEPEKREAFILGAHHALDHAEHLVSLSYISHDSLRPPGYYQRLIGENILNLKKDYK